MIRTSLYISILIAFLLPHSAFCQKEVQEDSSIDKVKETLPLKVKIKYADALFQAGNYYEAIEEYYGILRIKPDNTNAMYQLGECYLMVRDYIHAEERYGNVIEAGADEAFPLVYYRLAMMQKMNALYEEAKYSFAKYALRAEGDFIVRAKREIEACDFAKNAVENPALFRVTHIDSSINSPYSEYAPVLESGKLYYSSLNRDELLEAGQKFISRIYVSERDSSNWRKGKMLDTPFNSSEFHSGNLSFSPDGRRAYFTRCTDNGEADIKCRIVMSEHDGNSWSQPVVLSFQDKEEQFSHTHPAVMMEDSIDVIYFSSNRLGGLGGFDLWYVEVKRDGSTTDPVNLGPAVNTIDDEVTPFFHKTRLYFSSTGHAGLGGFDVFVSSGLRNGWSKPKNLGYPLNSSADDLYFTKGDSARIYYLVSNRPGIVGLKNATCCDDIFMIEDLGTPKYTMKGRVHEVDTATIPLTGARMEVFDITSGNRVSIFDKILAGDNEFAIELSADKDYEVKIQKKGYFSSILNISYKDNPEADDIVRNVTLNKIEKKKAYTLDKIYYDFNKSSLTEDSKESLQSLYELLTENPKLVVEIGAHTDDIGKESYNLNLSQQRAQSCVDYLIYLGIESKRLIPKGYGETMPIARNKNKDGTDNEEGRQQNRRTEFKVIGELSRVGDQIILD